jgi:hypothetical protein
MLITEDFFNLYEAVMKVASHSELWYALSFLVLVKLWSMIVIPDQIIKKLKLYFKVRHIFKMAHSFNHRQTLLGKYLLELPIKENEDEITSYSDISGHFGDVWPFMKTVKANTERELSISDKPVTIISSYSYLDLSSDPDVTKAAISAAESYGTGNNGPRMLCGNLDIHEQFEKKLSKFLGKEHALVFSSGYLACMSVITGLARKGDLVLMDKLCHNSL